MIDSGNQRKTEEANMLDHTLAFIALYFVSIDKMEGKIITSIIKDYLNTSIEISIYILFSAFTLSLKSLVFVTEYDFEGHDLICTRFKHYMTNYR